MWILQEDQFNYFRPGGLTVSELNSATIGLGNTSVFDRITFTTDSTGGFIALGNSSYLNLMNLRSDVNYDEIRISTSSLSEATPIPEPGTVAFLSLAGIALMICRDRRKI